MDALHFYELDTLNNPVESTLHIVFLPITDDDENSSHGSSAAVPRDCRFHSFTARYIQKQTHTHTHCEPKFTHLTSLRLVCVRTSAASYDG